MKKRQPDMETLVADLASGDVIKRQDARRALVAMGEAAVEPLKEALQHRNQWVRWEAAKALGRSAVPWQ